MKSQASEKLSVRRFGPFSVVKQVEKNAVKPDLPFYFTIHPVVYVIHTIPFYEQPDDVELYIPPVTDPVLVAEKE